MSQTVQMIKRRIVLFLTVLALVFAVSLAVQLYLDRTAAETARIMSVETGPSGMPNLHNAKITVDNPGAVKFTIPLVIDTSGDTLQIEIANYSGGQASAPSQSARDIALGIISALLVSGTFALLSALLTVFATEKSRKTQEEKTAEGTSH